MSTPLTLAAWLATYAVHSTILLGAAWIATRFIAGDRARETLWKAALVGSFVTSTIPAVAGFTPLIGRQLVVRQADNELAALDIALSTESARPAVIDQVTSPGEPRDAVSASPVTERLASANWTSILISAWLLIALALVARLVFHHRRLFSALRDRTSVNEGELPGMLAELRRKAAIWTPVRLTKSPVCPTPVALARSEICVPARFLTDLDAEQ